MRLSRATAFSGHPGHWLALATLVGIVWITFAITAIEREPPRSGTSTTYAWVEFDPDEQSGGRPDQPALALDPRGGFVLAWRRARGQPGERGVFARRFDENGKPQGNLLAAGEPTPGLPSRPAAAVGCDGSLWLAWETQGGAGAIFARRFDAAGSADRALHVDERPAPVHTQPQPSQPSVASVAGGVAVAWRSADAKGRSSAILARRFAADGAPIGPPLQVSVSPEQDSQPCIAASGDGFAVVWARAGGDGRPAAILGRRFDSSGAPLEGEVRLSQPEEQPIEPAFDANARGEWLAGWLSLSDGAYRPRLARGRFGASGAWRAGPRIELAQAGAGSCSGLALALRSDAHAVAAWSRFEPGGRAPRVVAQVFDRELQPLGERFDPTLEPGAGLPVDSERRIEPASVARQIVLDGEGRIAIAWSSRSGKEDKFRPRGSWLVPGDVTPAPAREPAMEPAPEPPAPSIFAAAPHEPPSFDPSTVLDRGSFPLPDLPGTDYGFLGLTSTGWTPPDPDIAASPSRLVAIVNGCIASFALDGSLEWRAPLEGPSGLWGSLGGGYFIFDPEVHYDPLSDRFFALACERESGTPYFLIAVSQGPDPAAGWHAWRLDVKAAAGDNDIDSPNMAIDAQAVYLCADFFSPDKTLVQVLDKAPLLMGGPARAQSFLMPGHLSVALARRSWPASAQYMVEADGQSTSSTLQVHAITDPLGTPQLATAHVSVPAYEQPENPPQLGTSIQPETFSARVWSACYRSGSLWVAHHVGAARVRVRWYEIDVQGWPASASSPKLVQWGDVDLGGDLRTGFGSIGADEAGNVVLVFARASPNEYLSMARAMRTAGDPPGTLRPAHVLQSSTAPDLTGRWGDYGGVAAAPGMPGAFWVQHEFLTTQWATWIALVGPCSTPKVYCSAKPTSLGSLASIGWTGEPSLGQGSFRIRVSDGVPGMASFLLWGEDKAWLPFLGGTLCTKPPLTRLGPLILDGNGFASQLIDIGLADVGKTKCFQFWIRDPANLLGAVATSDALEVTFCP
jgi:hypothetical protein